MPGPSSSDACGGFCRPTTGLATVGRSMRLRRCRNAAFSFSNASSRDEICGSIVSANDVCEPAKIINTRHKRAPSLMTTAIVRAPKGTSSHWTSQTVGNRSPDQCCSRCRSDMRRDVSNSELIRSPRGRRPKRARCSACWYRSVQNRTVLANFCGKLILDSVCRDGRTQTLHVNGQYTVFALPPWNVALWPITTSRGDAAIWSLRSEAAIEPDL